MPSPDLCLCIVEGPAGELRDVLVESAGGEVLGRLPAFGVVKRVRYQHEGHIECDLATSGVRFEVEAQ